MRLAEDRFYNTYPCIILTAKGQPDVATRWMVAAATLVEVSGCSRVTPGLKRGTMGQTDETHQGERVCHSYNNVRQCLVGCLACSDQGRLWCTEAGVRPACGHGWCTSNLTCQDFWKLMNSCAKSSCPCCSR